MLLNMDLVFISMCGPFIKQSILYSVILITFMYIVYLYMGLSLKSTCSFVLAPCNPVTLLLKIEV